MPLPDPADALAAGITVVTPNNRLARALIARHDAARMRAHARTWPAARAIPWSAWVETLWREALEAEAAPADLRLRSDAEAHHVWVGIVRDALSEGLADARAAADGAEEAWTLMHAWGAGGESFRAWRTGDAESDVASFAEWATRYHADLQASRTVDRAMLADVVRGFASSMPAWRDREIVLAGFLELTPQQRRLREALEAAGMRIVDGRAPERERRVRRVVAATPRDELRRAFEWARERALADPALSIGVAVVDLALLRDEVRAAADEALCPRLLTPGHVQEPRPYAMALGAPLAAQPMIACALELVALAHGALSRVDAAALARSPYLAGPWPLRAAAERRWIEEGRTRVAWHDFVAAMPPAVAAGMRAGLDGQGPRAQSPSAWRAHWRALLERCGWPGDVALSGAAYEVRQAWERLLDAFARVGHVQPRMRASEAIATLRDMARRTRFEASSPRAPIAIVSVNDAAALDFDALWVAGLSAQRWPPAPQPHPMLPVAWQRERGMPGASAARELAFARAVTARLATCAKDVVMSAPAAIEDYESATSALVDPAWPGVAMADAPPAAAEVIALARAIEEIRDDRAPPFTGPAAPGGAGTLGAQSTCPFQAMARRRLRVEPWPGGYEALSYAERGQLVHAMMAAFWLDVQAHATLVALDDAGLRERLVRAAESARAVIEDVRWNLLPPAIAAAELARIAEIGFEWIVRFERDRAPFTVAGVEQQAEVTLADLTFRLKLDRIDTLDDGTTAIIDYKTGAVDAPRVWFEPRPRSPQLGLYALALAGERDVRAVAYARLKAGDVDVEGLADNRAAWQALTAADSLREFRNWNEVHAWWAEHLPKLAQEFRDGVATVTPRDVRTSCRSCRLHALCRIGEVTQAEGAQGDDA
ncbi:MAG: PD-(D/E)XK nuclease family protein [Burkholderiales bacterium]